MQGFFMSEFTDFMTMKIIEERRLSRRSFSNKELELQILEQMNAVKNLNVRAPIHTIAEIETLANWAGVSKAEFVLEILSSAIDEAIQMIDKEGNLKHYHENLFKHLESDYGVILNRDENGEVKSFNYPQKNSATSVND
jgi:hypothetical protein